MICIICKNSESKINHSLSSKLQRLDCLVKEGIETLFNVDVAPISKYVCHECYLALGGCVTALRSFESKKRSLLTRSKDDSLVRTIQLMNQSVPDSPLATPESHTNLVLPVELENPEPPSTPNVPKKSKVSTPIRKKMKRSLLTTRSKISFQNTLACLIRKEIKLLTKSGIFNKNPSRDKPDFDELHHALGTKMLEVPTIHAVLNGLCGRNVEFTELSPAMTTIISVAAMSKNRKSNRLQKQIGILLWKTKASIRTYDLLNRLGLCASYQTVVSLLDSLVEGYDNQIQQWKANISETWNCLRADSPIIHSSIIEEYNTVDSNQTISNQTSIRSSYSKRKSLISPSKLIERPSTSKKAKQSLLAAFNKLDVGAEKTHAESSINLLTVETKKNLDTYKDTSQLLGMSISFDNVNKYKRSREYYSSSKDEVLNVVSAFAYFNRVPLDSTSMMDQETIAAQMVPLSTFVLSVQEESVIRSDHKMNVKKILADTISIFGRIKSKLEFDKHQYWENSCQKTNLVNLGILPFDENSNHGMIQIMEQLQSYSPKHESGKLFPLAVRGDGLTCDRQRTAQMIRLNSVTEDGKLARIYPLLSDWHRRKLLLEDDMKIFLKKYELTLGKGTLAQFKAAFGHKFASIEVTKNFNETYDFVYFCLAAYVTAFAVQDLSVFHSDGSCTLPDENSYTDDALSELLDSTAEKIVQYSWHNIGRAGRQTKYCFCGNDEIDSDSVGCDNMECSLGWLHTQCLRNHCRECKKNKIPNIYNDAPKKKSDPWFCSLACQLNVEDKVFSYGKDFVFSGLQQESFKYAIRYNMGDRLELYNKMHMIQFFNRNHPTYFRMSLRMHLYFNGCAPASVKQELLHNSTINLTGGAGHNLEADLVNEFIVKFMKDHVLNVHNQTAGTIARRSKAFGIVEEIRNSLEESLNIGHSARAGKLNKKWKEDLADAVTILIRNNVFSKVGVRYHEGFEQHNLNCVYISDLTKYMAAIKKNIKEYDMANACWNECSLTSNDAQQS